MKLSDQHCRDCAPGTSALAEPERQALMAQVPQWSLFEEGSAIRRDFVFDSYWAGLGFVNAVAWVAQSEKHHPDMELGYKKVGVRFSTHAAKGLTENDFICAAKVDRLLD
jgi:4a-hydroxytetrahydrobiopterin dehydratase